MTTILIVTLCVALWAAGGFGGYLAARHCKAMYYPTLTWNRADSMWAIFCGVLGGPFFIVLALVILPRNGYAD